jgi:hypothetical protein
MNPTVKISNWDHRARAVLLPGPLGKLLRPPPPLSGGGVGLSVSELLLDVVVLLVLVGVLRNEVLPARLSNEVAALGVGKTTV